MSRSFTNSPFQGEDDRGSGARRRVVRSLRHTAHPGRMEALRTTEEIVSVGRHAAVHYCPVCGVKRKDCRCGDAR